MPSLLIKTFKIPCQKTTFDSYDMILVKTSTDDNNYYCYIYTGSEWNSVTGGDLALSTVEIQNGYLSFQIRYIISTSVPTKAAYLPFNWT